MNKLRVAAYCRVSTNYEEQESSLETQISYYGKPIAEHNDWQLVKIYAERASRTQMKKRPDVKYVLISLLIICLCSNILKPEFYDIKSHKLCFHFEPN